MTQNSRILELFAGYGLTHDCNHYIPWYSGIELKPWALWNGMLKVPYFWEDDLAFTRQDRFDLDELVNLNGVKVFDFHPIHIHLNTEHPERYESSREVHRDYQRSKELRFKGEGTRDHLISLLQLNKPNLDF